MQRVFKNQENSENALHEQFLRQRISQIKKREEKVLILVL